MFYSIITNLFLTLTKVSLYQSGGFQSSRILYSKKIIFIIMQDQKQLGGIKKLQAH